MEVGSPGKPFRFFGTCIQAVDGLRERALGVHTVVEECEVVVDHVRAVGVGDGGIDHIGEISRSVVDAVHHGVVGTRIVGIELRACSACELRAPDEHAVRLGYRSGAPACACVDGRQRRAAAEHGAHVLNVGGGERAQIQGRQPCAGVEHRGHISHLTGIEVLQAADVGELTHAVEPAVGARGLYVGKRRVEHHLRDVGVVFEPAGGFVARVEVVGVGAQGLQAVVAEGEGAVAIDSIRLLRQVVGEVAGYRRAAVEAGILLVGVVLVVGCAVAAHQRCAALKHIERHCHVLGVPTCTYVYGIQRRAAAEHILHVLHQRRVEGRQVERCQLAAAEEHALHVGDAVGAEVLGTADVRQVAHATEPRVGCLWVHVAEREVEYHVGDGLAVGIPAGILVVLVQVEGVVTKAAPTHIMAEGEGARLRNEGHIDVHQRLVGEVAGVVFGINVGIGLVLGVAALVSCAVAALQGRAVLKHIG